MEIKLERKEALDAPADVIIVALPERQEKDEKLPKFLAKEDAKTGGLLTLAWGRKELKGKRGEVQFYPIPGGPQRIATLGLGPKTNLTNDSVRVAGGYLAKALRGKGVRTVGVRLASLAS